MVEFSKQQFYAAFTPRTPCKILHPWAESCTKASMGLWLVSFDGSLRFLIPWTLLHLLYNYKKINRNMIKRDIILHVRTAIFFASFGASFVASNCILRAVLGRFYYYVFGLLCGTLAGLSIFVESKEFRLGKCMLVTNWWIENVIRYYESRDALKRTAFAETLIFSICSSAMMYLFKTTKGSTKLYTLWMYRPDWEAKYNAGTNKDNPGKICKHQEGCIKFSLKGFLKFFSIGYGMEFLRNILRKQNAILKNPVEIVDNLLNVNSFRFGLFLGGYVGVYKWLMCYLGNKQGKDKNEHAALAGFLSGLTYYLMPNLPFAIIAFTTSIQLLLLRATEEFGIRKNVQNVPITEIVAAIAIGNLVHFRLYHSDVAIKTFSKLVDIVSHGKVSFVYRNLQRMMTTV